MLVNIFTLVYSILYGWISFHSFRSYWLEGKISKFECILRTVLCGFFATDMTVKNVISNVFLD